MSTKTNKPQWHNPVDQIGSEVDQLLEDTVEVGAVQLMDGPIDPVPLGRGPRSMENYAPPRRSAGPMPKLHSEDTMEDNSAVKSAVGSALDTVKSAAGNAGAVTKSALSAAAGTVSEVGASGAKTAGGALWSLIQRNPLQAIAVIASFIWLLRSNKTTASQPTVSLPEVGQKVGSAAGQVQVTAANLGNQIQGQAQHVQGWFGETLQSNPLALGAMALVFGAALGFAVPETAQEHQLMGKTRDKLADKAQEAASDLGQKVQTVAQTAVHEAIESGKEEAKNQGLTV